MRPFKTSRLAIPFPAIYLMAPPNVLFSYSIPQYLPNAHLQTSRLAIPFPAIYPKHPSKRPV